MLARETGVSAEGLKIDDVGADVRRASSVVADSGVEAPSGPPGAPIKYLNPGLGLDKPLGAASPGIDSEPGEDTIPDDVTTDASIALGEQRTGYVNSEGDQDWYRITLEAGEVYQFGLEGRGDDAVTDPYLRLFDADGDQVAFDDDGGDGLNSLLTFVAENSGDYYLSAGGYNDNTGRYTLSAEETELPNILRSIDWGTETPTTNIQVYFAEEGETYDGETSLGWNNYEINQAMLAFQQFSNIANVSFTRTNDESAADFKLVTTNFGGGLLGYFNPPGEPNAGVGVFGRNGFGWDQNGAGGLDQGGYGFITLIHEFGHGMGLAHPHDEGGRSTVMAGVTGPFDSYGLFDLNQGVYTTMSYNDGWQTGPNGVDFDIAEYGWQGTMMALDVAILQKKYGANTDFNSSGDSYVLAADNGPGTMYQCIWDTGGIDEITYAGADDAVINLKPATIDYSAGGGGYVSFVDGVIGGYTIARGVRIENASGGDGADAITGNGGDNLLRGGAGNDTIDGRRGSDELWGGEGGDVFAFSTREAKAGTVMDLQGRDTVDISALDAIRGTDEDDAFDLVSAFTGEAGQAVLSYRAGPGRTQLSLDSNGDGDADIRIYFDGDVRTFIDLEL